MGKELEVEVKTISKEMIKPSFPPPSHPTTFTLSLLDQNYYTYHVPMLFFYTSNSPTLPQNEVDIRGLKTSLSQTLDQFFPLAGRLLDESTISCNHKGIPFIETKVNCHLSDVMTSPHKLNLLTKFLPPQELQASGSQPVSELVPLAFQVNVFLCGGVVLGCYMLHKLMDAASLGTFLKYWSALASNRLKDLVQPDFKSIVNAFPPLTSSEHIFSPNLFSEIPTKDPNSTNVIKSFIFDTIAINNLKTKAKSEQIPNPTRFEVVAGFVWEQTLSARLTLGAHIENTELSIVVNMRPRLSPPLPTGSIGNLITNALAQVESQVVHRHKSSSISNTNNKLQEFVNRIRLALSNTSKKITSTAFQGENAAETIISERNAEMRGGTEDEDGNFWVTSWCKIGLNEADFGFGKPAWIVPTDGREPPSGFMNFFTLTDYSDPIIGDAIEAWLMLEEKEMMILELNPNFLAFASPN